MAVVVVAVVAVAGALALEVSTFWNASLLFSLDVVAGADPLDVSVAVAALALVDSLVLSSVLVDDAVGASANPNSSSSNLACKRLTKSALRPSVVKPRFSSSTLRSATVQLN